MKEFAKKNGWKVIGHFIDEGESAKTANRPELKKLIRYCKENKNVDIVIVHKIDRLARNLIDYATIKAILKQKGIRLVSVSETFEDNPVGHLLENIIASISEWYSANLGEEIKKSNLAKLKKGEWPGKPPVGYRSIRIDNRTRHIPDEKTGPLIRQAYELFATGNYSLNTLSEEMAERGLKTRFGKLHSAEFMKCLLIRRFYIGRMEWLGKEYKGILKPIISKELFYQVQEVRKKRSADTGEKGKLRFLLRGMAYCQDCSQRLTGEVHPRGTYYRCLPNINKKKCPQPYIPVSSLDSQLEALYARLQPPKKVLELLKLEMEDIAQKRIKIAKAEVKFLKRTIENIENKELKLLDEKLTGKVPGNVYERLEKKYQDKRIAAESRLSQLEVDYDDPLDFLDKCIVTASMLLYLHQRFKYDQRKNLLKAVFEKIYVRGKEIVDVKLNPPFSFLLKGDLEKLFKNHTSLPTKQDIFEQMVKFTLSGKYPEMKSLLEGLIEKSEVPEERIKAA